MGVSPSWSRERVVDAAYAILRTEGFKALSVRSLAQQLGCSRQVVYTHFGNMAGLWNALHQRGSAALASRVNLLTSDEPDVRVLQGCLAYVSYAREEPALFQLVFAQPVPGFVPDAESHERARDAFGLIQDLARSHLQSVGVHSGATRLAHALWTLSHGAAVVEMGGHVTPVAGDAMLEQAVTGLLRGWTVA